MTIRRRERSRGTRPWLTREDLLFGAELPLLAIAAAAVPGRRWPAFCARLEAAKARLRFFDPAPVARIAKRVLGSADPDFDARAFALASAAGRSEHHLQILKAVGPGGWHAPIELAGREHPDAAPAADPDNDGLANLLEFAFKANPLLADAELGPHLEHRANGDVVIVYRQRTGGTGWVGGDYHVQGLTYAVQTSPTLTPADWQTTTNTLPLFGTGESLITRATNGDGTETVSIPVRQPLSRSQLFLRLAVTPSGP